MTKDIIIGLLTGYIISSLDIWQFTGWIQRGLTIYVVCITVVAVISCAEDVIKGGDG